MNTYISLTDTAKLVRTTLKENFSGIKFSVKSTRGGSIRIDWTDGPSRHSVEKVVKKFEGASFDISTDQKSEKYNELDGEEVRFGADYVICQRTYTRAFIEAIRATFCERWGRDLSQIEITGTDTNAYVNARPLGISEDHFFHELLEETDGKNMHRSYEAKEERKQAEAEEWTRNEPARKVKEEKERQEQAKRDEEARKQEQAHAKARQQQEERHQREQAPRHTTAKIYTREQALTYLGLPYNANAQQIREAFRLKVKAAADGHGGYTTDMDLLVNAKEKALRAS